MTGPNRESSSEPLPQRQRWRSTKFKQTKLSCKPQEPRCQHGQRIPDVRTKVDVQIKLQQNRQYIKTLKY